jgi:MFS transporter, AAHS family, 3-hydroxyphenylpropionic acid transporter
VQPGNRDRPGHAVATIVCCVLAVFCEGIDLQAAGVAAGGIIPEFKPSPGQLGNFFSASTTGLFFGALIGGRLSDSIGRKRVVLASIVLFGVFSLLTALAPDMQVLYWARLLTGLGLGGALPNLIALVNECSAPDRRSANVALAYSGAPFGGAVASLISMSIAAPHWRLIFIAGGVAPLIVAPIMMAKLRESPAFERLRAEKAVAGGSAGGRAQGGRAAGTAGSSVVAILTAGRAIPTLLLWVSFFLGLLTLYLLLSWLPTLLVDHGMTKPQAAGAQIAFNVGGGFAALLMGQVLEGRLRHAGIVTTFVALPALILLLSRAPSAPGPTVLIVFALGCAVLAAQSFLYAIAPACYPTAIRGMGVGAAVAIGRIGSIVGPKLAGLLKAAGHGYSQLLTDLLPIAVIASVTAIALAWYTHRANPVADS